MAQTPARQPNDDAADALAAMTGSHLTEPPDVSVPAEDDAVTAPAPDMSVFAPKRRTADLVLQRNLHLHRTAIPVLLTSGVLLPAIGSLKWLAPDDSPFAQWEIWVPIVLSAVGVMLLAVAVLNMLNVRNQLSRGQGRV